MLVSIVITNFNYGAYLAQAIDSALRQTYPRVEVIVVDDGSTDSSKQIIGEYGGRIFPVLKENTGQVMSANVGYSKCKGDVVIFLDSDDVLFDDAVERHAASFKNSKAVTSYGLLVVTNDRLESTGRMIPFHLTTSGDYRTRFLRYGPMAYSPSFTSGNAWSRKFLEKVMPLPKENLKIIGPDGYLSAVAPLFGRVEVVERPLGKYRVHGINRGPFGYRFDAEFLRARMDAYQRRLDYAAHWAELVGVEVEPERWVERAGWKLTLAAHVLHLFDDDADSVSLHRLVASPFRERDSNKMKSFLRAIALGLTKVAPKPAGIILARKMLDGAWGLDKSRKRTLTRKRA